ncbi:MAG: PQQ-binding-like beta-propeller repeat protein [Candidatus Marinimicrobia bacterium]|nr:PQQ-binding-like beta-propeller repeat protein [Candidatus Neomarinimicrobiota bacterium]
MTKKYAKICVILLLITNAIFPSQKVLFRFAWLTDVHVGARTGKKDLQLSVQDINQQDSLDFVIISGDLTEFDLHGYLDSANTILEQLHVPYYPIPGNHDTKWSASGCTKFEKLWGDEEFTFTKDGIKFVGFDQGPIMKMGFGYVVPEDLRWLKKQVQETNGQPVIAITHYPIDESVGNYQEVLDLLQNSNIQAILHGHGHANRAQKFGNIPGIMGRSNLRTDKQFGGYNIVTVTTDSIKFQERITTQKTLPAWHTIPIQKRDFGSKNTIEKQEAPLTENSDKIKWQFDSDFSIASAPTVANGKVFFGNSSGKLYALDLKNGNKIWTYQTGNRIYSQPAIHKNRVVFSSTDSTIYCLNTKNGQLIWQFKTEAPNVASPLIHNKNVYIGSSDGIFRALSLKNGQLIWQFNQIKGFVETRPLFYDQKIIFGAWDNNLYALDSKSGNLAWKWSEGRQGILYSPAVCRPVASHGRVYIVAPDRVLSCIDAGNGKTIWRSSRDKVRESIGISDDGYTIFARCMWDSVVAIDATQKDFAYKWKKSFHYNFDIDPSYPIEEASTVFFGTGYGDLYAFKKNTGQLKWKYKLSKGLINTVVPISKNRAIITAMDGKVSCVEGPEN